MRGRPTSHHPNPSPDEAAELAAHGHGDERSERDSALDAVYAILLVAAERCEGEQAAGADDPPRTAERSPRP
jgi:hypothetical protein